jgi:molybdate transport system substrate-binding protein
VKRMKRLWPSVCAVTLALGGWVWVSAQAQTQITLLATTDLQEAFNKLIPGFEAKSGYKVNAMYVATVQVPMNVAQGQGADVDVMVAPSPEALSSGNLNSKSATTLASFVLAIMVAKGAPHPNVATPAAVKMALLSAKSIVVVDPAARDGSGVAAQAALHKLGLADQISSKIKFMPVRMAIQALADGKADFSVGPWYVSDRNNEMVDRLALPKGAYVPTNIVAYASAKASNAKAATALLAYLKGPEAEAEYKSIGMMPR